MTPERHRRMRELFLEAVARPPEARAAYLDAACGDDAKLRARVAVLLAKHAEEPSETPDTDPSPTGERAELLRPGAIVAGQYRVEGKLGAGGMGTVYRAVQHDLQRPVALKVVLGELIDKPKVLRRFRREALTIARLRHPHVVTVYDYDVDERLGAYLVMELLEGRSLREEVADRGRLPVGEALALMKQICAGVEAAHRAGVTHRDLKPANVFLERGVGGATPAPSAKVLDFGLARVEEVLASRALTTPGAVMGTPTYMSPEQCRGEEADARSDVYALGCILYETLTGRPPFVGERVATLVYRHIAESPRPPSELAPEVTPALDAAVLRALAKVPDDRFQTVADFEAALGSPLSSALCPPSAVHIGTLCATNSGQRTEDKGQETWNNLPHPVTHFVGRGRQAEQIGELLSRTRLVTLMGPGGIGKTRLALKVAADVAGAYDGVRLVELAALTDAALVAEAVASAYGVREEIGRSVSEALAERLGVRRVLLVLDNCEHLVEACARLAETLLRRCPSLCVLATSRESLGVAGEAVWPVPPLPAPDPADPAIVDRLPEYDATALFLDRARLSKPDFAADPRDARAVAEICRRLDGIPLAIELAAARVRVLSVEQILERLDDRFRLLVGGSRTAPTRQQTLRAALDSSYELLTEEEGASLRRLAVFVGGWTLDDALGVVGNDERDGGRRRPMNDERKNPERVSDSDIHRSSSVTKCIHRSDVVDVLERLVDKSLVVVFDDARGARYGMLETIREYALGRLEAGEAEEVARRHAELFLALAEEVEPYLAGPEAAKWLARMEAEHDNLRAALGWSLEHDAEACLRLAAALSNFWFLHGPHAEARRWLDAALERSRNAPVRMRAQAYVGAGLQARQQGDLAAARTYFEQGLRTNREAGDARRAAWSSLNLGVVAMMQGERGTAYTYAEETLADARKLGLDDVIACSLMVLGEVSRAEGRWVVARAFHEQALATCRRIGRQALVGVILNNLGASLYEVGDLKAASSHFRDALAVAQELGTKDDIALSLDGLGAVAAKRGAWERAARLAGAAEGLREAIGYELEPADREFRGRYVAAIRERLGDAALEAALDEGRALTLEQAERMASEEPEA
jgi:predicted ATPase/serine/threonine protein kinase